MRNILFCAMFAVTGELHSKPGTRCSVLTQEDCRTSSLSAARTGTRPDGERSTYHDSGAKMVIYIGVGKHCVQSQLAVAKPVSSCRACVEIGYHPPSSDAIGTRGPLLTWDVPISGSRAMHVSSTTIHAADKGSSQLADNRTISEEGVEIAHPGHHSLLAFGYVLLTASECDVRCPVLSQRMVVQPGRSCFLLVASHGSSFPPFHAMSGTDILYAATRTPPLNHHQAPLRSTLR